MSGTDTAASGAQGHGAVRSALMLARAAWGTAWVAIAHAQGDGRLRVIESSAGTGLGALELPGLDEPTVAGGFVDLRRPVSSAWTMACGQRPTLAWVGEVPASEWILVVAFVAADPADRLLQAQLGDLRVVLTALAHAGERVRAEQIAAERMAGLIRHIESPVLFLDHAESTVFLNPAAAELLAVPAHSPPPAQVVRALRQLFAQRPAAAGEAPRTTSDDAPVPLQIGAKHWALRTRRIDTPALSGWLWLFSDTTVVVRQQHLLMEARRAETVTRVIGGVAHQFNNLLTVVLGGADLAANDPALVPHLQPPLIQVVEAAERGATIVAQLLAFGQRDGRGRAHQAIVLAEALRLQMPLLESLLPDAMALTLAPVAPELAVLADPRLFSEVMINLVLNAREAIAESGQIDLSVEPRCLSMHEAESLGLDFREAVVIRTRDTGSGMELHVQARAFEPFFSTRGLASARGLGLSVVEGWVQGAGGRARIESAPGAGTLVELILPRSPGARRGETPTSVSHTGSL